MKPDRRSASDPGCGNRIDSCFLRWLDRERDQDNSWSWRTQTRLRLGGGPACRAPKPRLPGDWAFLCVVPILGQAEFVFECWIPVEILSFFFWRRFRDRVAGL